MKGRGLQTSSADPCLFVRYEKGAKLIVPVYIDGELVSGTNQDEIDEFIHQLSREFKISVSPLTYLLGMQIKRRQDGIFVNQRLHAEEVLRRFNLHETNPVRTPSDRGEDGSRNALTEHVPHREAVGCLMYLTTATRLDLAFAMSLENPTETDWLEIKRIMRYLRI